MATTRENGSGGFWNSLFSKAGTIFGGISDNIRATGQSVSYITDSIGHGVAENELAKQGLYNKTEENKAKYRSYAIFGSIGAVCLVVIVIYILKS